MSSEADFPTTPEPPDEKSAQLTPRFQPRDTLSGKPRQSGRAAGLQNSELKDGRWQASEAALICYTARENECGLLRYLRFQILYVTRCHEDGPHEGKASRSSGNDFLNGHNSKLPQYETCL